MSHLASGVPTPHPQTESAPHLGSGVLGKLTVAPQPEAGAGLAPAQQPKQLEVVNLRGSCMEALRAPNPFSLIVGIQKSQTHCASLCILCAKVWHPTLRG